MTIHFFRQLSCANLPSIFVCKPVHGVIQLSSRPLALIALIPSSPLIPMYLLSTALICTSSYFSISFLF